MDDFDRRLEAALNAGKPKKKKKKAVKKKAKRRGFGEMLDSRKKRIDKAGGF